jgi:hypothetical protein
VPDEGGGIHRSTRIDLGGGGGGDLLIRRGINPPVGLKFAGSPPHNRLKSFARVGFNRLELADGIARRFA